MFLSCYIMIDAQLYGKYLGMAFIRNELILMIYECLDLFHQKCKICQITQIILNSKEIKTYKSKIFVQYIQL